jgi:hypothetical protein
LFFAISAAVAGGKPVFNEDGSISCGEKNVKITPSGFLKIKIEGSVIDGSQQFYLRMDMGKKYQKSACFKIRRFYFTL